MGRKNKLSKNGFAITGILYSIFLLVIVFLVLLLTMLANNYLSFSQMQKEVKNKLDEVSYAKDTDYASIVFEENPLEINKGTTIDLLSDVKVVRYDGEILNNQITYTSSPDFDSNVSGNYVITYRATVNGQLITKSRVVKVLEDSGVYSYLTDLVPNSGDSIDVGTDAAGNGILKNEGEYGIRFEGKDPNNYVSFNEETWRIIGIVDGKVKIIRNDSLGNMTWDGSNKNNWANAPLQKLLNGDYYNSTGTYADNKGIKAEYKNMIDATTTWSLLGSGGAGTTKANMYTIERTTGSVSSGNPRSFTAPIGLMYLSDYGFAVKETEQCPATQALNYYYIEACKSNNWLFNSATQWTITPSSSDSRFGLTVASNGVDTVLRYTNQAHSVRPVLNLASNVKITGGTGAIDDMYILAIEEE